MGPGGYTGSMAGAWLTGGQQGGLRCPPSAQLPPGRGGHVVQGKAAEASRLLMGCAHTCMGTCVCMCRAVSRAKGFLTNLSKNPNSACGLDWHPLCTQAPKGPGWQRRARPHSCHPLEERGLSACAGCLGLPLPGGGHRALRGFSRALAQGFDRWVRSWVQQGRLQPQPLPSPDPRSENPSAHEPRSAARQPPRTGTTVC